ncbi:MAG TPA: adenylate cyclase, partial [Shewanella sp.]|nr:adenylate cyclase [Shewanella sp.]
RLLAQLTEINLTGRLLFLWQQTEYGQLQLAIVELLLKISAGEVDITHQPSLRQHADRAQQASWMAIIEVMPLNSVMTAANYLQVATVLDASILVGHAYGSLYEAKSRDAFRAPWQDLALGIKTLACYRALQDASRELDINLAEWLEDKQQSLLFAMESTRRNAMQQQVYW